MRLVAALGDSLTCGEGVGVRVEPAETWVGLLAASLPGAALSSAARPGACVHDIERYQLALLPDRAEVVTILAGLNDMVRAGFDGDAMQLQLKAVVDAARDVGDVVLLGRYHDPIARIPLPRRLAAELQYRLARVNAVVDQLEGGKVAVLDLATIAMLDRPEAWSVDRVHPSRAGHRAIAAAAVSVLRGSGRWADDDFRLVDQTGPASAPSPTQQLGWVVRHGIPYAARNLRTFSLLVTAAVSAR